MQYLYTFILVVYCIDKRGTDQGPRQVLGLAQSL